MSDPFTTHGAFSWIELMTTDPEAAKDFYRQLLGWELEENPMGFAGYTVVKAGGKEIGGIMGIPEEAAGMPPKWTCYVTVKDVHTTAKLAASLGGKVLVPPRDIEKIGTFCVIEDPQGASLCAITYKPCAESSAPSKP